MRSSVSHVNQMTCATRVLEGGKVKEIDKFVEVKLNKCKPIWFGVSSLSLRGTRENCPAGRIVDIPEDTVQPEYGSKKTVKVGLECVSGCNLNCLYCYQHLNQENWSTFKVMTAETAKKFLAKFTPPEKVKSLHVSFCGGEPTLNMDLWVEMYYHCKERYSDFVGSATSNGTRFQVALKDATTIPLPPEISGMTIGQWFIHTGQRILVSLDGGREVQDAFRPYQSGVGTFDDVMSGLHYMKSISPEYVRRMGFAARLFGMYEEQSILDRVKFFNELSRQGIGRGAGFGPAISENWKDDGEVAILEAQFDEMADWFISELKAGRFQKIENCVTGVLRNLLYKKRKYRSCEAGTNVLYVGAHGDLYPCHRTSNGTIGTIDDGIDPVRQEPWKNVNLSGQQLCRACDFRYLCGVGCRGSNVIENGCTSIVSKFTCELNKIHIKTALKIIRKIGIKRLKEVYPQRGRGTGRP
jgi:uncharacterized protein